MSLVGCDGSSTRGVWLGLVSAPAEPAEYLPLNVWY